MQSLHILSCFALFSECQNFSFPLCAYYSLSLPKLLPFHFLLCFKHSMQMHTFICICEYIFMHIMTNIHRTHINICTYYVYTVKYMYIYLHPPIYTYTHIPKYIHISCALGKVLSLSSTFICRNEEGASWGHTPCIPSESFS